eukprot:CAMPEP_0201558650 /NCGR_PEP_ID=MMETSP0173_2-20130828/69189_1 /ASSEMBLY_ACC=CAM_ASM_000268 /TAXON_ID=218659 /ORGANISM="Vexillifera sp., Strain DIVA3 564/2" /LENGTH=64 /DNA_ID=CAMNT_0047972179 /DNA_START=294 /DNA_END=488 /DNA_ORIENTATION=-
MGTFLTFDKCQIMLVGLGALESPHIFKIEGIFKHALIKQSQFDNKLGTFIFIQSETKACKTASA